MAVIHKISIDNKEILVRIVSHICLILFDVIRHYCIHKSKLLLSLHLPFDVIACELYTLTSTI